MEFLKYLQFCFKKNEVSFGFIPQLLSVSASLAQSLNFSRSQLLLVSLLFFTSLVGLLVTGYSWFLLVFGLLVWSLQLVSLGLWSLSYWSLLVSGFSYVGLSWFPVSLMSVSLGLVFTNRKAHKRLSIIFFFIVFHTFCI